MADVSRFQFTRPTLDGIQPPLSGRLIVWDAEVAGLGCRVTATGARSLWLSKWANGGQRWIKIGDHPTIPVKEARSRALELLAEIARGGRPWEARKILAAEATLGELWTHYHEHHAKVHKRPASIEGDVSIWRTILDPWAGKKRLSSITRGDVQRMITTKGKTTPTRANRTLALLSSMFNQAIAAELWGGANPAKGVQRFKERSRDRFLQPDELRAVFASLDYEDESWIVYFRASILCGARRGNLLGMRWADLELTRGLWRVPGEESKNGEPLLVILPADLVQSLVHWQARCTSPVWVFPSSESDCGHKVEPRKPWDRVLLRGECFRLLGLLGAGWSTERMSAERAGVIADAGHARLFALGSNKKADEPLLTVLESLRLRVTTAGLDPLGKTLLDVRLHDLRRTMGSWAAMTGASTAVIGKALGHRSQAATAIYARLNMDPVRAAVEAGAQAMLANVEPKGTP